MLGMLLQVCSVINVVIKLELVLKYPVVTDDFDFTFSANLDGHNRYPL